MNPRVNDKILHYLSNLCASSGVIFYLMFAKEYRLLMKKIRRESESLRCNSKKLIRNNENDS